MPKLNPYLVKENQIKTEEVRYLNTEIPSYKEFLRNYEVDERVSKSYESEISGLGKGYGPCQNSSCDCNCSAYDFICNNYNNYGHGGNSKREIKIDKKTSIKGFQHLIHTANDYADRNGCPNKTSRNELWDGDVSVSINDEVGLHSVRSSVGVNAGLGGVIASGGADYSLVRISDGGKNEINFLNGNIGGEIGAGPGGLTAGYTLGGDVASVKAGGFRCNVGYDAGSGVAIGPGGIEAKVAGLGISFGKKMGISTPIGGISVDLEETCIIQ